jgi:hypothetical protein
MTAAEFDRWLDESLAACGLTREVVDPEPLIFLAPHLREQRRQKAAGLVADQAKPVRRRRAQRAAGGDRHALRATA